MGQRRAGADLACSPFLAFFRDVEGCGSHTLVYAAIQCGELFDRAVLSRETRGELMLGVRTYSHRLGLRSRLPPPWRGSQRALTLLSSLYTSSRLTFAFSSNSFFFPFTSASPSFLHHSATASPARLEETSAPLAAAPLARSSSRVARLRSRRPVNGALRVVSEER